MTSPLPSHTRSAPAARIIPSALSVLAVLAVAAPAWVGQWRSYTDKSRVTALVAHGDFVYAGTQGGIRRIETASLGERDYDNLDGLVDPWIAGFAADSADGSLWAVARDGYVYELRRGGTRWNVHGRSYAALGWKMNPRAVLGAGRHLYLGSTKGLTVFDRRLKVSQLNVTRFGNDLDPQVLSLLRRADTLYVGTSAGVYKMRVDFTAPLAPPPGYPNLADHNQWTKVDLPPDSTRRYDHLAFIGDSLATFGPGTLLQAPVRVEAFAGDTLVIGAHAYPGWNGYTAATVAGGKVFVGGDDGLAVSAAPTGATPDAAPRAPLRAHPRDTIMNIDARGGRVWGHSRGGLHRFDGGGFVFAATPGPDGGALYDRFLRNVKIHDESGDVYVATWGSGLNRIRDGQTTMWRAGAGSCLHEAFPGDPWTVSYSLSRPRHGGLYFTVFKVESGPDHQLAWFNLETETVHCLQDNAAGGYPHAIETFGDTLVAVANDRGVNFLIVREGVNAPLVESSTLWTLPGSANEAWDLAADRWGRPWAIVGDQLAYLDSLDESTNRQLKGIENFAGRDCKNLEGDPAGKLWVGCGNGLFHVETDPFGALVSVRRYTIDDGLPGTVIHDLSVDPSDGRVWVATDRGVGVFESPSQPSIPAGELAAVVPYPNPFRPHHAFVIFDKLPVNATLRLHEPSGRVIRIFHPRDLTGNQVQWDGRNEQGRRVSPGVYTFSVTSGTKVQRGKVIVAR